MLPTRASHTSRTSSTGLNRLSDRQAQCLGMVAEGLSSAGIADRLGISSRTVDEHLTGACRLLGVRTRIQAVARLAASQRQAETRSFLP